MGDPVTEAEFEQMVADAIDNLPKQFREVIDKVAVVISDLGAEHHAYGMYYGDGMSRDFWEDRIVIYRDTLTRDFGHDRIHLAARAAPARVEVEQQDLARGGRCGRWRWRGGRCRH